MNDYKNNTSLKRKAKSYSLLKQLYSRSIYHPKCNKIKFENDISLYKSLHSLSLSNTILQSPHSNTITCLDVDTNENRFLACSSLDGTISIYDLIPNDNGIIKSIAKSSRQRQCHGIHNVKWYPIDSGLLLSSSKNGIIQLWDVNAFEVVLEYKIPNNQIMHSMSDIHPTNASMVVVGCKNTIVMSDITSGSCMHTFIGHGGNVNSVVWYPGKEYNFVSGGEDGSIRLWDVRKSGAQACLAVLDSNFAVEQRKIAPNQYSKLQDIPTFEHGSVLSCEFTPDGQYLISAYSTNSMILPISIWDMSQSNYAKRIPCRYILPQSTINSKPVVKVVQPASHRTAVLWYSNNDELYAYELYKNAGKPSKILRGHLDDVSSLVFQNTDMRLYSGSKDGMILCWGKRDGADSYKRRDDVDDWSIQVGE